MPVIELNQVSFAAKKAAESFTNLSISVRQGTFFVLTGLSAAAEKSFMQLLLGIKQPTAGQVFLVHYDVSVEAQRTLAFQQIGVMSQSTLQKQLTVQENLTAVGRFQKNYSKVRQAYLLKKFGLTKVQEQTTAKLTKLQQQKLALAVALLHNPSILILEEPFKDLADKEVDQLTELLLQEAGSQRTIFLITEKLYPVLETASKIAVVQAGQLATLKDQSDIHKTFSSLTEFYDFYTAEGLQL